MGKSWERLLPNYIEGEHSILILFNAAISNNIQTVSKTIVCKSMFISAWDWLVKYFIMIFNIKRYQSFSREKSHYFFTSIINFCLIPKLK